ncbi:hypothetical protein ALQ65_200040 [Pseudomonas syringae pv. coriandricola]|uniref:Uncharacterized protein n=1 Tax=Pseudomonas syringae pv. coriandricola TaxID=264453 RepID=A0A3M3JAU0_9PSED|nr:hypothetical protein ALQ65_200040 [Pseudomonas syringae pv. coriandricola]
MGQSLGQKLAEYSDALGEQVASAMEGKPLNKDDNSELYLIGGGGLAAGLLTGVLASGKFSGKSKVVTAEMRADPYHPDWKNYTGKDRGVGADVVKGGEGGKNVSAVEDDFFAGTKYTDKVLGQIKTGDLHGFPESVTTFQGAGQVTKIKGGDGVVRDMLKIPGEYRGKQGVFEFIKESDGSINHRLFKPTSTE